MPSVGASLRHHWQQSSGKCQLRLEPLISTYCAAVVRHGAAGLECFSFENKSNDFLFLCTSAPLRLCASAPLHLCLLPSASCFLPPTFCLPLSSGFCHLAPASAFICHLPFAFAALLPRPASCLLPPSSSHASCLLNPASCLRMCSLIVLRGRLR